MIKSIKLKQFQKYGSDKTIEAYGTFGNFNWSYIQSKLIQLAGRFCDSYASDIIIDINAIQAKIDKKELQDGDCFVFGFREMGVDDNSYIQCRNAEALDSVYLNIWRLDIGVIGDNITFNLYRVKYAE